MRFSLDLPLFFNRQKLLEHITFVDSPGVLSGEKQRTQRAYDFTGVTSWFAAKCDLILLLFDPHKLDVSDEFKRVISSLHGHDDKIRVVLNKADQVDTQQVRACAVKLLFVYLINLPQRGQVKHNLYLALFAANEGLWSINVVTWEGAEYT